MSRIVVAGANGFIGRALVPSLAADGHSVLPLSRKGEAVSGVAGAAWDGASVHTALVHLSGADAVINLVGAPINQEWNVKGRKEIVGSRLASTRAIGEALQSMPFPPSVWINGSATGYYGDAGETLLDESSPAGHDFLGETCAAWEQACTQFDLPSTRRVLLRTGVVFGPGGGMISTLSKLTRAFLGGAVGNGRQFIPWIHLDDEIALIKWCLDHEVSGPVNATAPEPVRNGDLMRILRSKLHRPWSPPAPAFMVKLVGAVLGFPAELALVSDRVKPIVAQEGGFVWKYPDVEAAVHASLNP